MLIHTLTLSASVTDDTTTINLTDDYRNNRTTYMTTTNQKTTNMKKITLIMIMAITTSHLALGTQWHVGPTQAYTLPSQVKLLVADGDTINIDGGIYSNDAVKWVKKNLKFFGLGTGSNRTILQNIGDIANGKGIWVFELPGISDNPYIENIVFDGAQISDVDGGNGAGIRYQSKDLTIKNCKFMNCQNGILEGHGSVTDSNVILDGNEFSNNGYAGTTSSYIGYEHHIYISSSVDTLWVKNNYFHDPRGQANSLKTRAQRSWILNNYIDEAAGDGSYELNIAQGGLCIVMGNVIIQGTSGSNHGVCDIDAATNPINELYFINNTVINKYVGNIRFFTNNPTTGMTVLKFRNNVFASTVGASNTWFNGTLTVLDTANNRYMNDYTTVGFTNSTAGDYSLTSSAASLINNGTNVAPASNGYSLTPLFMYANFSSSLIPRTTAGGAIDIGAYEYGSTPTGIKTEVENNTVVLYPNPSSDEINLTNLNDFGNCSIAIYDILGKQVYHSALVTTDKVTISTKDFKPGMYMITIYNKDKKITKKIVVD